MASKYAFVAATLALANFAASNPIETISMRTERIAQLATAVRTVDTQMRATFQCHGGNCPVADWTGSTGSTPTINRQMLAALECRGQSCLLGDTSGSTGRDPTMKAEGASDDDIKCIAEHNPAVGELLKKYYNKPPDVPKQETGSISSLMIGLNTAWRPLVAKSGSTEKGNFTGTCTPNILIFAKGTFEPGTYGVFIGPSFTSGLPAGWSTAGVAYDVDVPGDFCLGLPGGMVAKDVINQAAQKCPTSNLFLSGYSQGAMVIRNGLARADDSAKARVKGVITFGDPFNGSPIKGYNGPIAIFCNSGDGVCTGNFELRPGHLSYGMDTSASLAQKKLLEMAAGKGDNSCCNPPAPPALPTPEEWKQTLDKNGGKVPKPKPGTSIAEWGNAIAESHGGIPKGSVPK